MAPPMMGLAAPTIVVWLVLAMLQWPCVEPFTLPFMLSLSHRDRGIGRSKWNDVIFITSYDRNIRNNIERQVRQENDNDSLIEKTNEEQQRDHSNNPLLVSRRNVIIAGSAVATYFYGKLLYTSIDDIEYPELHEKQIKRVIQTAFLNSVTTIKNDNTRQRPFRVLEVGIGTKCRLICRGLYNEAIQDLIPYSSRISSIELTGLDFRLPNEKVMSDCRSILNHLQSEMNNNKLPIHFQTIDDSITSNNELLPDGYYDTIICCLTLCSVDDPDIAIRQMKRLLRRNGGTFGYIEHVAVNDDETSYHWLQRQQELLDPLQQLLVDNCHLHRHTEQSIMDNFMITTTTTKSIAEENSTGTTTSSTPNGDENDATILFHERFFVDAMWPVSCQCCGVIQRI